MIRLVGELATTPLARKRLGLPVGKKAITLAELNAAVWPAKNDDGMSPLDEEDARMTVWVRAGVTGPRVIDMPPKEKLSSPAAPEGLTESLLKRWESSGLNGRRGA